jgi:hypothetical protein
MSEMSGGPAQLTKVQTNTTALDTNTDDLRPTRLLELPEDAVTLLTVHPSIVTQRADALSHEESIKEVQH